MPDDLAQLPWTDEQWAAVQRLVHEAAGKARVASSFLPLVGPLPPGQASVPALTLAEKTAPLQPFQEVATDRLEIDDSVTLKLNTIACEVHLGTQQVEDPDLASAKQMLGRAADVIGRLEDAIVFNGEKSQTVDPTAGLPKICTAQGGQENPGLLSPGVAYEDVALKQGGDVDSDSLVKAISTVIQKLEKNGHFGPFACVLGHDMYVAANAPTQGSFVVPRDRIVSFLDGGPLRRSSVVPPDKGVVVSLAGSPVDLVVASDVHVKFLQISLEPRYVLRISERFVLRVKQPKAIYGLQTKAAPPPDGVPQPDETAQALEKVAKALEKTAQAIENTAQSLAKLELDLSDKTADDNTPADQ